MKPARNKGWNELALVAEWLGERSGALTVFAYSRHYDALSFGEHARRGSRIFLYCGWACSLLEVPHFTFAEWPWWRYHNYPSGTGFICPGCRRVMKMQVSDPTVPGTGGR